MSFTKIIHYLALLATVSRWQFIVAGKKYFSLDPVSEPIIRGRMSENAQVSVSIPVARGAMRSLWALHFFAKFCPESNQGEIEWPSVFSPGSGDWDIAADGFFVCTESCLPLR